MPAARRANAAATNHDGERAPGTCTATGPREPRAGTVRPLARLRSPLAAGTSIARDEALRDVLASTGGRGGRSRVDKGVRIRGLGSRGAGRLCIRPATARPAVTWQAALSEERQYDAPSPQALRHPAGAPGRRRSRSPDHRYPGPCRCAASPYPGPQAHGRNRRAAHAEPQPVGLTPGTAGGQVRLPPALAQGERQPHGHRLRTPWRAASDVWAESRGTNGREHPSKALKRLKSAGGRCGLMSERMPDHVRCAFALPTCRRQPSDHSFSSPRP